MSAPRKTRIPYGSDEFAAMWREGVPVKEIARRCGVSAPAVCKAARRMGIPRRKQKWPRRSRYDSQAFRDAWLSDMKLDAIAAAWGVHVSTVWQAGRRRGLPLKLEVRAAAARAAE